MRARFVHLRRQAGLALSVCLSFTAAVAHADVQLPTPMDHYEDYDPELAALALFGALLPQLDPDTRESVLALVSSSETGTGSIADAEGTLSEPEIRDALEDLDWETWRPAIVEVFLHRSRVLEVIPDAQQSWLPLVHDSLLLFLNRLGEGRFLERLLRQNRLAGNASRGDLLLAFVERTPSLQKLGQILARYPEVAGDLRAALQTLENGIVTTGRKEVVEAIEKELGEDVVSRHRIHFADELLAEASVGAVIRASLVPSDRGGPEEAVCKLLKPYAIVGLEEELRILEEVIRNLQDNGAFYDIGKAPVVELFEELRDALAKEIQVTEEQANLNEAAEYYRDVNGILVPAVYPFSTPGVTCMEYVDGVKITDAFAGDPDKRAELAKRLSDALTFDVIFSATEESLFHGDPHAGNVLHVAGGLDDPYRIALIDWGLAERFPYEQRARFVQLLVGITLGDPKRLVDNVGALVHLDEPSSEQEESLHELVEPVLADRDRETFEILNELLTVLAREGYAIRFNTAIFIKSQLTIAGILVELDPEFEQGDYLMDRVSGQVFRETHTRLLRTLYFPAWNSHDYRSMMSNEDVKDIQLQRTGAMFKKFGKGIWAGFRYPASWFH